MNNSNQALITKGAEVVGFDPRKFSKRTIRFLIFGTIIGFILFNYHENIVAMMEDSTEILILGLYGLILGIIIMGFWKQAGNLSDFISRKTLFWIIQYDPWMLQYKEIDKAEEDWNDTLSHKAKLEGKYIELDGKVHKAVENNLQAKEAENILIQELKNNLTQESRVLKQQLLEDEQQKQVDNLTYVKNIAPLVNDLKGILEIVKTGEVVMKHKIERMRRSLTQLKDTYDSAAEGASALKAMQSALTGNQKLNSDVEQSKLYILQGITMNIGQIRTSGSIIAELTTNANLQDKAKMQVARKQLEELGITTENGAIPIDAYQKSNTFQGIAMSSDTKFGQMPD